MWQKYDEVSVANASGGSSIPLTPAAALKLYMTGMTLYEQGEILDYPQVGVPRMMFLEFGVPRITVLGAVSGLGL